jgi:ATP-dependent helicase HrpA
LRSRTVPAPDQNPFPFRLEFPPDLPITARAQEIVDTLQSHSVIILAGETGSGKTTQIPKLCLAAGGGTHGQIACTQPRRVAALSVSRRVAQELGVEWGGAVGCKVRFTDQTSRRTVIKFLTDGMLLAEVQSDPLLRAYDTIIIDEAHERSLNIDFLLGHLRQLRFKRPELRIVITSATIDTAVFSKAFDDAPVIEVSGRAHPVEVVYAPLDALGSDAAEGDEPEARAEALHYIDGALEAVERILAESSSGDVLVFMPAERDIRELADLLAGRARGCEVVPLFGRLSNADQQRVFASSPQRKIIVATNIAETSLTIPGIRYVVDTGLARISRYSPQGRTRRLPIEPVAQSSADQRKGRAGRVAAGICIRLYSEKDYLERPRFTQPEIQRANLADVILRLKAYGLGEIERFPFINMPATKSMRAGYALLEELGALAPAAGRIETKPGAGAAQAEATGPAADHGEVSGDKVAGGGRELTAVGRELARLPVDPTVGRMILQARAEKALREVVIIAAGLSIQDPRERPLDKQAAADAAHRRFAHPDSDFLTLLNIWEALHDEFDRLSPSRLRRWCHDHFLSYTRLREWRDIHHQLMDTLEARDDFRLSSIWDGIAVEQREPARLGFGSPGYRAVHRSILAGLLGNLAVRDDEKGGYRATHDRRVSIFPGSGLFRREERKQGAKPAAGPPKEAKGPRWLMAAEIMETTRLYARTCARLDPAWALDLGAHLLKVSHSEPFWDVTKGRVMVRQRTRLYGLEIEVRAVGYGRIDPAAATEIFIREGLVNDTLTWPFDFLRHNREVREQVENQLTRARDRGYLNLDEGIYRFYAERLLPPPLADGPAGGVSAVAELVALVRERKPQDQHFLEFQPEDLRDPDELVVDADAYPEALPLNQAVLPLAYAYKPGEPDDGVTLEVGLAEATTLTPAALDWAVPGHLLAKVEHYLRALPKELRRAVLPLAETARSLTAQLVERDRLTGRRETIAEALAVRLGERFNLRIDPAVWADKPLPDHLRVRVRVTDTEGRELAASRDLVAIQAALEERSREASQAVAREDPDVWRRARREWEMPAQLGWPREVLPEEVVIGEQAGVPIKAYPTLQVANEGVAVRLARTPEEAARLMPAGLAAVLESALRYELGWLERDLRALRDVGPLAATLVPVAALQADVFGNVKRWVTDPVRLPAKDGRRTQEDFQAAVALGQRELRGLVPRVVDRLREILTLRQALLVHPQPYPALGADVEALLPPDFVARTPFARLAHLPRYLRAMQVRADRWRQNPIKDAERARQLAPYVKAIAELAGRPGAEEYRWLVEELRVSLFAQELGTAEPVSTVKLDRVLQALRAAQGGPATTAVAAAESGKAPTPVVVAAAPTAKSKPLKSLTSLDQFFGRR